MEVQLCSCELLVFMRTEITYAVWSREAEQVQETTFSPQITGQSVHFEYLIIYVRRNNYNLNLLQTIEQKLHINKHYEWP